MYVQLFYDIIEDKIFLLDGMLVVSLNTLPYHMLSQFHADETVIKTNINFRLNYFQKKLFFIFSIEIVMDQNVV